MEQQPKQQRAPHAYLDRRRPRVVHVFHFLTSPSKKYLIYGATQAAKCRLLISSSTGMRVECSLKRFGFLAFYSKQLFHSSNRCRSQRTVERATTTSPSHTHSSSMCGFLFSVRIQLFVDTSSEFESPVHVGAVLCLFRR